MFSISSLSSEYVRVQVQATSGGIAVSPTTDAAAMAFVPEGATPQAGDWKTASWETDTTQPTIANYVRAQVGPGGAVALVAGIYDVWVKVTDSPEVPVKRAGSIRVI